MRFRYLSLILGLTLFSFSASWSQEVLTGDVGFPVNIRQQVGNSVTVHLKTTAAAPFPFFDDFSYDSLHPSAVFWDLPLLNNAPGVSISKGYRTPSKGVATFDGAYYGGRHYDDNDLIAGLADTLTSNSFDLSGKSVSDSLYLSFFLEPGGLGDFPEFVDSFYVWFDTTGDYEWKKMVAISGDSLNTSSFSLIMVPVREAVFFHNAFRFKFGNLGSLNGELDQWHLDYVYFDQNRNAGDTIFNDQSVVNVAGATLNGYTQLTVDQYNQGSFFGKTPVELHNLAPGATGRNLKVELLDGLGNLSLSGTLTDTKPGVSIPGNAFRIDSVGPLSSQTVTDSALFQFRVSIDGGDSRPGNDTILVGYHVDSLLAYDDGVSDRGYGLTAARAFCQEFTITGTDTLTGVWINFAPTLYYNGVTSQVTSLENKSFKVTIWFDLHPDSILQQRSGAKVQYGDTLNTFFRYTFFEDVPLTGTFWIGIDQVDEMPIGIGFDRNFINDDKIYFENSQGQFVNTNQGGTLMIRPEFGNREPVIAIDEAKVRSPWDFQVYPNPANDQIWFRVDGKESLKDSELTLVDFAGRAIHRFALTDPTSGQLEIPAGISAGVYFIQFTGETNQGNLVNLYRKIVVTR